jgi:hypothetical protein
MKRKVIEYNNLPAHLPIVGSIAFWLLLDRLNVPGWAWGVYWTLISIIAICEIYIAVEQEKIDIFIKKDGQ